jgi:E3 ubiquitin-protein ligase BRE1
VQLLDDLRILIGTADFKGEVPAFPAELFSAHFTEYQPHLNQKSAYIKETISLVLKMLSTSQIQSDGTLKELQNRLSQLSATEKAHAIELKREREEKLLAEERYTSVYSRAMVAEKKLDRAKSQTVAKIEKQAIMGGGNDAGSGLGGNLDTKGKGQKENTNGTVDHDVHNEVEVARKEAVAATEKQKEQLDQLQTQNDMLSQQITALNIRLSRISDEDVAKSEVFKLLKSQHEDVINRINHLEASNAVLREEAGKFESERTSLRVQLEAESKSAIDELESSLGKCEADLSRLRATRDELAASNTVMKACQDQERIALEQVQELVAAGEQRISALESEIERLKIRNGESASENSINSDIDGLDLDELKLKYKSLENEYAMLKAELMSMQGAYKKAQSLATKKVINFTVLEEKVQRLQAEKSKADQKYFSAMKAKEARDTEIRTMKAQNAKSAEVVAQLKDVERANNQLVANLEKNLAEYKSSESNIISQLRSTQQQTEEQKIYIESLRAQVTDLSSLLSEKDLSLNTISKSCRQAETERERLSTRLDETKKSLDMWKSKSGENEEDESLRVCESIEQSLLTSTESCTLQCLQVKLQGCRNQILWTRFLQELCRRTVALPFEEMSYVRKTVWPGRYYGYPPLTSAVTSTTRFSSF